MDGIDLDGRSESSDKQQYIWLKHISNQEPISLIKPFSYQFQNIPNPSWRNVHFVTFTHFDFSSFHSSYEKS